MSPKTARLTLWITFVISLSLLCLILVKYLIWIIPPTFYPRWTVYNSSDFDQKMIAVDYNHRGDYLVISHLYEEWQEHQYAGSDTSFKAEPLKLLYEYLDSNDEVRMIRALKVFWSGNGYYKQFSQSYPNGVQYKEISVRCIAAYDKIYQANPVAAIDLLKETVEPDYIYDYLCTKGHIKITPKE